MYTAGALICKLVAVIAQDILFNSISYSHRHNEWKVQNHCGLHVRAVLVDWNNDAAGDCFVLVELHADLHGDFLPDDSSDLPVSADSQFASMAH